MSRRISPDAPLALELPPRRILIIKPSSLGDVVHTIPVLNLLRRKWPAAHISWLVAPYCAGAVERLPGLDEVILFDRKRFGQAWWRPGVAIELLRLLRELRGCRFDLVIDVQGLLRSGYIAWKTRAAARVGFANAREMAWAFYTHTVDVGTPEQHAVDRYLKLAASLGCGDGPVEFTFPVTGEHHRYISTLLPEGTDPFAVLMPGTNWPTKRWPAESFEALVRPLRERLGLRSVLAGGPDAAELAGRIPGALNLAGRTNIPQLVALLERAALVIANDSGPMHIAAALGRPLVAIFGPTNPVRTGPYGRPDCVARVDIPCSPCYSRHCSHHSCLRWLTVEQVMSVAERQCREGVLTPAGVG
jgi:lipopolysaccharide heptosyltransferase I